MFDIHTMYKYKVLVIINYHDYIPGFNKHIILDDRIVDECRKPYMSWILLTCQQYYTI